MEFSFGQLTFAIEEGRIGIIGFGGFKRVKSTDFIEIQIAGEMKYTHLGMKPADSSEGKKLAYVSHNIDGDTLTVVQKSELISVETTFTLMPGGSTFSAKTKITNISDGDVVLEDASALVLPCIGDSTVTEGLYFTRFIQGHHAECQPRRLSFDSLGFFTNSNQADQQKRISFQNIGSWSTKEELPQGIIENERIGGVIMFEIDSNNSWYYEISDIKDGFYLYLTGASSPFGSWAKRLGVGESYTTPSVALAYSNTVAGAINEMTAYRRTLAKLAAPDSTLPTIFNEYMHLSWDSPFAERTAEMAPIVADLGIEYYVIDCGWHNEEPGDKIYPFVGQWKQSHARFPKGVRATTDYIRSLGMKAGLWIEPEIVGEKCTEMLEYYDDDCFIKRYGKKIASHGRYFLDYRNEKVRAYMSETIRRMVEDYGADYIKFDYNQDMGVGSDKGTASLAEGLELCTEAFLNWADEMRRRFPGVVFEGCASGGMRMDYKSLGVFSLVSTSDQVDYLKYPYIAGNILSAVIPEQAAVWSYPVGRCTKEEITDDEIIMNMVNSFLGRMHLASHLEYMNESQLALVREGVAYYKTFSEVKKTATPVLPLGFTHFGDERVAAGLKSGKKIYLAVWCLSDKKGIDIPLGEKIASARLTYPMVQNAKIKAKGDVLRLRFDRKNTAAFFEIELA